jgi:hypothetical protein
MLLQLTDQACVWMRAGVIRFWLCDRNFDCDHCPLDAALRGSRSAHPQDVHGSLRKTPAGTRTGSAPDATGSGS